VGLRQQIRLAGEAETIYHLHGPGDKNGAMRGHRRHLMADRSGAAGHQKRLALHGPGDKDGAMRGHRRHAQGRSFGEREWSGSSVVEAGQRFE
jgi:hypothetical protein